MTDVTYNSLSTLTISTGQITARNISTASTLTNYLRVNTLEYTGTFATSNYQAYTIPWMAMQTTGSIHILDGIWQHDGTIVPARLSVPTELKASSITAYGGDFRELYAFSLHAPVVSSFFISTAGIGAGSVFASDGYFDSLQVMNFSTTGTAIFTSIDATDAYIRRGLFSTLSTATWQVGYLEVDRLNFYDFGTLERSNISLCNGVLYIGDTSVYTNVVRTADLVSTTEIILDSIEQTNRLLNYAVGPLQSSISTTVGSNFDLTEAGLSTVAINTTQELLSTSASLQGGIQLLSNFTVNTISNVSAGIDSKFVSTSNYIDSEITAKTVSTGEALTLQTLSTGGALNLQTLSTGAALYLLALSTGSNFVDVRAGLSTGLSNLSTTLAAAIGSAGNIQEVRDGLSTGLSNLSTQTDFNFRDIRDGLSTSISTLSTSVGNRFVEYDATLSSLSASVLSLLENNSMSSLNIAISNLSVTTDTNFLDVRIGISTLSTSTGYALSNLSVSMESSFFDVRSGLSTGLSNLSVAISIDSALTKTGISTLSTNVGIPLSTVTGIATVNTSSISSISTLFYIYSSTSSELFSSKVISTGFLGASSISSGSALFQTMIASTMSSITSFTANLQASSFSGTFNDATTYIFQRL